MAEKRWTEEVFHGGINEAQVTLANGDTTNALDLSRYPEMCIHVVIDSGVITDLDLLGSNEDVPASYQDIHQLHDPSLTFTSITDALLANAVENPRFLRVPAGAVLTGTIRIIIVGYTAR